MDTKVLTNLATNQFEFLAAISSYFIQFVRSDITLIHLFHLRILIHLNSVQPYGSYLSYISIAYHSSSTATL